MPVITLPTAKVYNYNLGGIPKNCVPLAIKDPFVAKLLLDAFYQEWYKFGIHPFLKEKTVVQEKMEWLFVEPHGYLHLPKTINRYFLLKNSSSSKNRQACRDRLKLKTGLVEMKREEIKDTFHQAHPDPLGRKYPTLSLYTPCTVVSILVQTHSPALKKLLLGSTFLSFLDRQGFEVPLQGYSWNNLTKESPND